MKTLALALAALVAVSGAPARAAAPVAAKQDSRQADEDYRLKTRPALDVIEDQLAALESDAKTAAAETRAGLQAQAKALRAEKSDADRQFEQLETATDETRRELQAKLDQALSKLKQSIRKAQADAEARKRT
jgi:ribosome-associated translation inhibitor RaiA